MRIALLIERFGPGLGGVENVAWHVARGLACAGDEVHVVARRAVPSPGVHLHPVRVPDLWQPLRVSGFSRAAARVAPRGSYDVVYSLARTAHQDVYRAGGGSHASYMQRRYAAPGRALRRVSPRHAVLLALEGRVFRDPTQLVQCNSEMVRAELRERHRLPAERTPLVRNGVDLEGFRPRRQRDEALRSALGAGRSPVWLFAGSGFFRKGLDTALRALAGAAEGQLWVAGADPAAPWSRLARSLGVASRVRFLGFRRDLAALYGAADALLLPTRYDACSNVCLEAAASGMPVLTSGANGAAEILGDAGRVVSDPEDVEGFRRELEALADPRTRARLGEAARAATEGASWSAHVAALRRLFAALRP